MLYKQVAWPSLSERFHRPHRFEVKHIDLDVRKKPLVFFGPVVKNLLEIGLMKPWREGWPGGKIRLHSTQSEKDKEELVVDKGF